MSLVVAILVLVSIMLLGASVGRPLGWIAIGLCTLALLLMLVGGGHFVR